MSKPKSEENDIPFVTNDTRGRPGTMDKPVDAVDAPARADSELGEDQDTLSSKLSVFNRPDRHPDTRNFR